MWLESIVLNYLGGCSAQNTSFSMTLAAISGLGSRLSITRCELTATDTASISIGRTSSTPHRTACALPRLWKGKDTVGGKWSEMVREHWKHWKLERALETGNAKQGRRRWKWKDELQGMNGGPKWRGKRGMQRHQCEKSVTATERTPSTPHHRGADTRRMRTTILLELIEKGKRGASEPLWIAQLLTTTEHTIGWAQDCTATAFPGAGSQEHRQGAADGNAEGSGERRGGEWTGLWNVDRFECVFMRGSQAVLACTERMWSFLAG